MPQQDIPSTKDRLRSLFASVLQDNEHLKVRSGQTVVFNDSDVGKPRDRLEPQILDSIEAEIVKDSGNRVDIPLTDKGNQKAPAIEVAGISGKGEEGERLLFRQEKDLGISVNEVGDRLRELSDVTPPEVEEQLETDSQLNEALSQIERQDEVIEKQQTTIEIQNETLGIKEKIIESVTSQLVEARDQLKSKEAAAPPISGETINVFAEAVENLPQG